MLLSSQSLANKLQKRKMVLVGGNVPFFKPIKNIKKS